MEEKLVRAFKEAKYTTNKDLSDQVWSTIMTRNKRVLRIKLWTLGSIVTASFFGLIPTLNTLSSNLSQSGFYDYSSLIFSDLSAISAVWKEFSMLLAGSLPVFSILISLTLIFIFLISIKNIAKQLNSKKQLSVSGVALSF